jgi:8-oxo-dGTP pyrophosphatase MutT (NUDIX family)
MARTNEVAIFVRRGPELLVVHRSPTGGAYWHTIAGGVEEGETAAEAARRELQEETGIDAQVVGTGVWFVYESTRVDCFLADVPDGWEPALDHEHDDYRWVAAADAPAALYWPDLADALRRSLP